MHVVLIIGIVGVVCYVIGRSHGRQREREANNNAIDTVVGMFRRNRDK